MAVAQPIFFLHGNRVVRGSIKRRMAGKRVRVEAGNYVLADGSIQPIPLDFNRVLGHEEFTTDAAPLLALVKPKPKRSK